MAQNQDEIEQTSFDATNDSANTDPFDRLMFGNRSRFTKNRVGRENTQETQQMHGDYTQLLTQVDDIMNSINKLKPVVKQLSPLVNLFRKK